MCEHHIRRVLDRPGSAVVRCLEHSRPGAGVEFWAWAEGVLSSAGCPCADVDRFVVVSESADQRWLASADVVVARPRRTMHEAREAAARLGSLPGCAFAFVPLVGVGAVVGGRVGMVALDRQGVCAVCLYSWLVAGGRLVDLNPAWEAP